MQKYFSPILNTASQTHTQRGVALLSVIFILAFISVFAVYMLESDYLSLRRVQNISDAEQAFNLALGSERWSARRLQRDVQSNEFDYLEEAWSRISLADNLDIADFAEDTDDADDADNTDEPDGDYVLTRIEDAQARLNINNLNSLINPNNKWLQPFQTLFKNLDLDENIVYAIVDWLDADIDQRGSYGAEDSEYQLLDPAYRAANQAIADIGELLYVKGIDQTMLEQLAPFITALPPTPLTKVNVNTCSAEILQALGIDDPDAQTLVEDRINTPFEDIDAFFRHGQIAAIADDIEPYVTVSSEYFKVYSSVQYGRARQRLISLLKRDASTEHVNVIGRSRQYL